MDEKSSPNLVLLTYKGKALLMYKSESAIDKEQHNWSFIGGRKTGNESIKQALCRRVEKEAGIKIDDVEYLSDCYYIARLTDDNVNNIKRSEDQLLDFFTLRELQKLPLSTQTQEFVQKYGSLIEKNSVTL